MVVAGNRLVMPRQKTATVLVDGNIKLTGSLLAHRSVTRKVDHVRVVG